MNSKVKTVNVFKTTDGKFFESRVEAGQHQIELDFNEYYEQHELLGNVEGSKVEVENIKNWLKENKERVLRYVNAL